MPNDGCILYWYGVNLYIYRLQIKRLSVFNKQQTNVKGKYHGN